MAPLTAKRPAAPARVILRGPGVGARLLSPASRAPRNGLELHQLQAIDRVEIRVERPDRVKTQSVEQERRWVWIAHGQFSGLADDPGRAAGHHGVEVTVRAEALERLLIRRHPLGAGRRERE